MASLEVSSSIARSRKSRRLPMSRLALHLALILGGLLVLAPFIAMLLVSLFPKEAFLQRSFNWEQISLRNYVETFTVVPFARFYLNSLIVATCTTLLQIVTASLAAFAFARLRFRGRNAIFLVYLAALMIPFQVTMIPNFVLIRFLRWYNSYQALILPAAFSAFSTFLLRQYYRGIPMDLDEAARMDGASSWRIWWQIIMPLSGPVLATLAIFNFQTTWNDFLWPLVITNTDAMRTIPVGLSSFQGQYSTEWHLLMAGSVVALLPVLLIYILAQRWFVQGITLSGIAGR
jgi:multiple sugar transport system permease protein